MRSSALEETFVRAFPNSSSRNYLWNNYPKFIVDTQRNVSPNFVQWIDGSFCTSKTDPYDIDVVTFIDQNIFQQKEAILENYWPFSLEEERIDAYWVEVYPLSGVNRARITQSDQSIWQDRFGTDRGGYAKGFI